MKYGALCLVAPMFFVFASPLQAQATRTWVSGVGDDVNPCSRTAPCKTFAGAISKTAPGGEINCLDPAGYGAVNITKSLTIDCGPYTMGGILSANVNGVTVNAANIVVTLRGLTINGANTTTGNGVRILNAAAVNIDDVVIENFGGNTTNGRGIVIETSAANVRVNVQNSSLYNLANHGIHSNPSGGNVILVVDHTTISRGSSVGIQLRQLTTASINNSSITNHNVGAALTTELSTVTAHVSNSLLANNAIGIFNGNGGNPTTRIFGNTITGNTAAGLSINSGLITSYGNNAIRGNGGNEAPSGAAIGTQ